MILQTQSHNLAHKNKSEEQIAIQEQILSDAIDDARAKSAKIKGWGRSVNGRIVIYFEEKLPMFYFNILNAVDSLIHQYNLVSSYNFIYRVHQTEIKADKKSVPEKRDISQEIITNCDLLLLKNEMPLNIAMKRKVYRVIHKANLQKSLSYTKFLFVRGSLIDHYNALFTYSRSIRDKKHIRKVVRFFEDITYADFNDLH